MDKSSPFYRTTEPGGSHPRSTHDEAVSRVLEAAQKLAESDSESKVASVREAFARDLEQANYLLGEALAALQNGEVADAMGLIEDARVNLYSNMR